MTNVTWRDRAFNGFSYLLLTAIGLVTIYPFINMLAVSLNDGMDALKGGIYFFPRQFTFGNYAAIFAKEGLIHAALLSVARTVVGTVLGVLATVMISYTLSRREFVLRKYLNIILVFTLFVNAGLLPTYLMYRNIGLMNTFAVYILPLLISAYNVILVRSYFDSLPAGLTESARIDGASDFQTLFRIVFPVSMPVIATITLFVAVQHWNSWMDNYLYTSGNPNLNLLQLELYKILQSSTQSGGEHSAAMTGTDLNPDTIRAAMTMLVTVPILFVYPFLQRYFVKGIMVASMKE